MALVASSTPLASIWGKGVQPVAPDEKRPVEHAAPSSASPSSRRTSSSSADTLESSSGHSFGTQHSGDSSKSPPPKTRQRKRGKGPDVILHVQDCAFAVHSRVLKHKCRVLYRFIAQLRTQNAVGHVASGRQHEAAGGLTLPFIDTTDDDDHSFQSRGHEFALRQRDPLTASRSGTMQRHRCPLAPRQQLSDCASPRSTRIPKVRCVADQRAIDETHHDSREPQPRPAVERQHTEEFSPGKENYVGALATSSTVRTQTLPRVALAPRMPFTTTATKPKSSRRRGAGPSILPSSALSPSPPSPPQSVSPQTDPDAFAVELLGASADAVAAFLEFLYSGKTSGVHEANAIAITRLCKWFCMEDHLLYAALITRAKSLHTVEQWMDILLCCTNLRSEARRKILISFLLRKLTKLPREQYENAMGEMPLHRLAAIEDADLLGAVLTCMVNRLRSIEIWNKLTFALELWLFWSFHRRFAAAVPLDHPHPVTVRQPLSLLDFHHKYASWDPVIRILGTVVSGPETYVTPTTLFSFGPFAFQVRFEPKGNPLISWRVLRLGTSSDPDDDDVEQYRFRPGFEPAVTVRGRLSILYKRSPTAPLQQSEVAIKYTHSQSSYGKWHVLLTPSAQARQVVVAGNEPESEEKTQDPESSQEEETAPLYYDSDPQIDMKRLAPATPPPSPATPPPNNNDTSDQSDSSQFELMSCHFSGQFFAWGHRLCNLYHYLLVSTLFYQVPRGSPPEMFQDAVQTRMRELPIETLLLVLQSDRLSVPQGETTVAVAVATLCLSDYGTLHYSIQQIQQLFQCVRWCFVDLEQIMVTLEHSRRELQLYELIEHQLRDHFSYGTPARRAPWHVDDDATPYRATTTLVEFQIEAGDRSLSPSKSFFSQE